MRDKITELYNQITSDENARERVFGKIDQKLKEENKMAKKVFMKPAIALATAAAVICLCGLGGVFKAENAFSIVAHAAMDMATDGKTYTTTIIGGENDGFANAGRTVDLEILGKNIKEITFETDNDNDHIRFITLDGDKPAAICWDENGKYVFDYKTNKAKTVALCYVGAETIADIPESVIITATAAFEDGTAQTEFLTVGLR